MIADAVSDWGTKLLRRLDPETAHALALKALSAGLGPRTGPVTTQRLTTRVGRLTLPNPVGLAAGFDKDAMAVAPLSRAGFGLVEVGAATPRAQPGNPRPRMFRLSEDRAAINRFGFNNAGARAIAARLSKRPEGGVPVGLNLGANKDSADRAADYAAVLRTCGPHIDFATVNVSSPNTAGLRDLQAELGPLLDGVMATRDALARPVDIWIKIAPDLSDEALDAMVPHLARADAVVATNTTLARDGLRSLHASEAGGLSGQPLFERSTRILAKLRSLLPDTPLIGVGGVGSAEQAYAKITAGASAVQLYTALAYAGPGLVREIAEGLDALLARDGFASVADAVGTKTDDWLN
ncbi:quinone-dependent dihydroorotate dehydrogenase [Jannaschia sp. Os4]|uniref:quinone-dependent dihydroorotate dehydrogenase n=1 Tax=Jannaschia sp. Os4 TaxID=2807617 RepID=UPI00193A7C85|nr:quinone-dependent dihydroorotate dehydrogenase [Jannaschia sp. Os4]MBM2574684.1 quinone-dependent dihydroorotate dehydrogenase [Jannaschia sp. Os4]